MTYSDFGVRLFREMAGGARGQNLFVSPVSAGMALAMAYNGATGDARDEMARALGFGGMELERVNEANERLRAELESGDVDLAIANSLWAGAGLPFSGEFLERARRSFAAEAAAVEFRDPGTAERINAWASEATRGRIPEVARFPFPAHLILLLINAVYFKGRWSATFDAARTRPRPFHAPGGTIEHPMMERRGDYKHLRGDGFSALRMPYAGDRFAMYVFLPDEGAALDAFVGALTAEAVDGWVGKMRGAEVVVAIPRFTLEGKIDLVPPLRALGMSAPFAEGTVAFGGLFPPEALASVREAYIGQATHRTFVEVNEEGTEAAAVTDIAMMSRSAMAEPPPPIRFTADRPFAAAIRDDRTGALLFVGQVADPSGDHDPPG
jgi:serine protease inhibitor